MMVLCLHFQKFAEVDEMFLKVFGDELSDRWTILNNQGIHHELIYNAQPVHPLVISGWSSLEGYYNLPNDVVVTFCYYGKNKFGINGFTEIMKFQDLPVFHSRYVFKREILTFEETLTPINVDLPRLVKF